MFNDFITIRGHHTFRKSEIQGIEAGYKNSSEPFLILYFIVSGNKIEVDRELVNKDYFIYKDDVKYITEENRKNALSEYHDKWFRKLEIGEQKDEKVMI